MPARSSLCLAMSLALSAGCTPAPYLSPPAPGNPPASLPEAKPKPPADSARVAILPPEASPISFEQISRFPQPGVRLPRGIQYAPNGKVITYLQAEGKDPVLTLFALDLTTRE